MRNLICDAEVASTLSMSRSWVRGERRNRRKGLSHTLNIDPVMVGSSPRYRIVDIEAFIEGLTPANENSPSQKGGVE